MSILTLILGAPAAAALLLLVLPRPSADFARMIALIGSGVSLLLTLYLASAFDMNASAMQFVENREWIPEIGMSYAVGVDGVALVMLLLTTIISLCCLLASKADIQSAKAYFIWFLLLEAAVIGVFCAMDWFLFFMFWEFTLIPMFFLIGVWGGSRRDSASLSFFLYTLAGSVAMLIAIVAIYTAASGHSFAMDAIAKTGRALPLEVQIPIFLGFLIGLGVKMPIVPLHGWLPLAHVEAPIPASMFLSAIMLKMGGYGLLRVVEILPDGLTWFVPILFAIGVISLIYGALLALRQSDLKAMVAYASISHMGFVLIGLAGAGVIGFTGAVTQMVAHGFASALLFFLVGIYYERFGTREISALEGAGRSFPRLALITSLALLASMGLPGFVGFVGELHIIVGAFKEFGLAVIFISFGILLSAAYTLRVIARLYAKNPAAGEVAGGDARGIESVIALPLLILLILFGVIPGLLLGLITPAIADIASIIAR